MNEFDQAERIPPRSTETEEVKRKPNLRILPLCSKTEWVEADRGIASAHGLANRRKFSMRKRDLGNALNSCSPTHEYLEHLHAKFAKVHEGIVASYIPELAKADPNHFGIAMVTATGAIYEVGDSGVPFTIQSISKPFVYGMALEDHGSPHVLTKVGVEPTGEAFNSINLTPGTGRPRNPMVNAGAIASAGLVLGATVESRIQRIIETFSRYTGRRVTMDQSVYHSESETGHRNRAIGHLLRNFNILETEPTSSTELYFMQCSLSVTCRDLAVMAATLANRGVNPLTGVRAIREEYVSQVLSVMSSCGMYDFAGEWLYKVGMPAKSGVAGGVIAVLPGQLGIAVYSPRLDPQGNTVRGVQVCEAISRDLELHLFAAPAAGKSVMRRKFTGLELKSTRAYPPPVLNRLNELRAGLLVYQLQGSIGFPAAEVVSEDVMENISTIKAVLLDFKRVLAIKGSACRLLEKLFDVLFRKGAAVAIVNAHALSGMREMEASLARHAHSRLRIFDDNDLGLEWAEEQLLDSQKTAAESMDSTAQRGQYALLEHLTAEELKTVSASFVRKTMPRGEMIVHAGSEARELFFLARGHVSVWIPLVGNSSKRVATLCAGMAFGEMALLDGAPRSANVVADSECECDILANNLIV